MPAMRAHCAESPKRSRGDNRRGHVVTDLGCVVEVEDSVTVMVQFGCMYGGWLRKLVSKLTRLPVANCQCQRVFRELAPTA